MSQSMNSDAGDEIKLDTAVRQLDKRATTDTGAQVRKVRSTATSYREAIKQALVLADQFRRRAMRPSQARLRICQGSLQQSTCFRNAWVISELVCDQ